MPVTILPATEALHQLSRFDAVIDARTEDEFALDHVPGAINWPTLNNQERIDIGTLYKQVNPFEAKKRGAALSARNIAAHIEREVLDKPKGWRPLVYCWRGGNRSGALATILGAIGFKVTLIEGGYRAWRAALVADFPRVVEGLRFRVVCGPTGSGKTRLLHALSRQGAQVLDLEALACHRSSVLGVLPGQPQPGQKRFESLIWSALSGYDPSRDVFVESESKKVGNLRVPDALMDAMRAAPCIDIQLDAAHRVALLLEDYQHFVDDTDFFCRRLQALVELRGHETVNAWTDWAKTGRINEVVHDLLMSHYDPVYAASIRRNFTQYGHAEVHALADHGETAIAALAETLLRASPAAP